MRRFMITLACLVALVAPIRPPVAGFASAVTAAQPTLADLHGVDELRTLFNRDTGMVRLVLLVSPT